MQLPYHLKTAFKKSAFKKRHPKVGYYTIQLRLDLISPDVACGADHYCKSRVPLCCAELSCSCGKLFLPMLELSFASPQFTTWRGI
jgi:hypothetical protein